MKIKMTTPYKDVNKALDFLVKGISEIFRNNLVGVYLTGSLSYGDFNPKTSDIDLVVVITKAVSNKELKLIKILHNEAEEKNPKWKERIECSYVPTIMLKSISPPKSPRPYIGEGKFYVKALYGNEWIINNYYLYKYGISLAGKAFSNLVKSIDISEVQKACIRDLHKEWEPKIDDQKYLSNGHYQSYLVLNLCRILYTILCGELASKKVSARWVKKNYKKWNSLIEAAEKWEYGKKMNLNKETADFIKFVIEIADNKVDLY